jgi:hypothetical protein
MRYIKHAGHATATQQAILKVGLHKGVAIKSINKTINETFQQTASQSLNKFCMAGPPVNVNLHFYVSAEIRATFQQAAS